MAVMIIAMSLLGLREKYERKRDTTPLFRVQFDNKYLYIAKIIQLPR